MSGGGGASASLRRGTTSWDSHAPYDHTQWCPIRIGCIFRSAVRPPPADTPQTRVLLVRPTRRLRTSIRQAVRNRQFRQLFQQPAHLPVQALLGCAMPLPQPVPVTASDAGSCAVNR